MVNVQFCAVVPVLFFSSTSSFFSPVTLEVLVAEVAKIYSQS